MNLDEIRKKVDTIDFQILKLLNTRMELALRSKKFKKAVEDPIREQEIIKNLTKCTRNLFSDALCEKLFTAIMKESKRLQNQDYKLIGFQGEHGAFSEAAAFIWDDSLIPMPCVEFTEVFRGVGSGLYDFGIVPVENLLGGNVSQVNELIINTDLFIIGAIEFHVHHCLLAPPNTDYRELRAVYSHSQALEQCHNFLERNNLEPIPYYDTAGAAKMLAEKSPKASAAIASKLAAEMYNLEVIKENIENLDLNLTRFLILSKERNKEKGNKCSITFSTAHKAGTLFKVLKIFADANINLSRIESVPNRMGSFAFFLDFLGSDEQDNVKSALEEVKKNTQDFRLLGCYSEKKDK